jgi:hypothetical protein
MRRADHATPLYPQKLVLTSQTSGGRSVGIDRSRTKATELLLTLVNNKLENIFVEAASTKFPTWGLPG